MTTTKPTPVPSPTGYSDEYVPAILSQWAAARDLHAKTTRYSDPTWDDHSYESYEDYVATVGHDDETLLTREQMSTFDLCSECARIEEEQAGDYDDWSYQASEWPCPTAKALGGF